MPRRFRGERTLMRIFVAESDRCEDESSEHFGRPLFEALLHELRRRGFAGATVVRGIAGFGASARLHYDRILPLSSDLPIVVDVVERRDKIDAVLPVLDRMIGSGLITLERVQVILYRSAEEHADERARDRTHGLEPDPVPD